VKQERSVVSGRLIDNYNRLKRPNLINSRTVFIATIIVIPALALIVYLQGINNHRSLYVNAIISTTILSIVFLIFITIGLYNGWKLRDEMGNFLKKFDLWKKPSTSAMDTTSFDINHTNEYGAEGWLISLLIWIVVGLFGSLVLWLIGAIVWLTILVAGAILYWMVFRALRLIFRNSPKCKGHLVKSFRIAFVFTFLYSCWIYAIILGTHYLNS
jgi:hypothetical protein